MAYNPSPPDFVNQTDWYSKDNKNQFNIAKQNNLANYYAQVEANKANIEMNAQTNEANRQMNERNNQLQMELANQANEWNIQQWQRENEYNSPAAQRQRLLDAGINPIGFDYNNVGGTGLTSEMASTSASQDTSPSVNAPVYSPQQYTSPLDKVIQGISGFGNVLNQVHGVAQMIDDMRGIKFNQDMRDVQLEDARLDNMIKRADNQHKFDDYELREDENGNIIVEVTKKRPIDKSNYKQWERSESYSKHIERQKVLDENYRRILANDKLRIDRDTAEDVFKFGQSLGEDRIKEFKEKLRSIELDNEYKDKATQLFREFGLDTKADGMTNLINVLMLNPEKAGDILSRLFTGIGSVGSSVARQAVKDANRLKNN